MRKKKNKPSAIIPFRHTIEEINNQLSNCSTMIQLDEYLELVFDDISELANDPKCKDDSSSMEKIKAYETKVTALKSLWREKILMDNNLNLSNVERNYHLKFNNCPYETDKIVIELDKLNAAHEKYFYCKWIKCNYRLEIEMNWDDMLGKSDKEKKFIRFIGSKLRKYYQILIKHDPNIFHEHQDVDYSQTEPVNVTKQFVSKLIISIKRSNIRFDEKALTESFYLEYDTTVKSSYTKINKRGNETIIRFLDNLWSYLSDEEKATIIGKFTKNLS